MAPSFNKIEGIEIKQPDKYEITPGLDLYAISSGTQPVIKLEMIFPAGKWFESKNSVSMFTAKMLREGAGPFSSFEISELFDSVGAHLEVIPSLDVISITIYSLEKHLARLIPAIKSIIKEPTFPDQEQETLRNIQIQTLKVNNEKTNYVAGNKFRESLFGPDHPYGKIINESDLSSINKSDLDQHFQDLIKNQPFTLIASGLFEDETIDLIKESFSSPLAKNGIKTDDSYDVRNLGNVDIEKEGSSQSSIKLGSVSIPMSHPDFTALYVTNEILGGYFGSRLMKNIREDKGLTYGIYSSLSSLRNDTFFSISADVKKELKEKAFEEIKLELKKLRMDPVGNEELTIVRNYMLGQIQSSISTPFELASKFKNIHFNGLGYDYYTNLVHTINTISPDQIMSIANNYLHEENMVQVSVG